MKYTNFLQPRQDIQAAMQDINLFEASVDFKLPPIYKVFYRLFEIETFQHGNALRYLYPPTGTIASFLKSNFNDGSFSFALYNFLPLTEALNYAERIYSEEDLLSEYFIYPIGECFNQGSLMLGYGDENADCIFVEYGGEDERLFKLADSIFDFLSMYNVEPDIHYIPSLDQLYKNWGEDFWRIRDADGS
jgi:hypothetical protein